MSPLFAPGIRTVPGVAPDTNPPATARKPDWADWIDWADDSARPGTHTLPEGMRLLDYEIVGPIGEGGFGIVYLAWDHSLQQHVAIKEYLPAVLASRASVSSAVVVKSQRHLDSFRIGMRSFVNEARLLARFDHPSLVRVLHFWESNGTAYMAMPYYEGPTLARALAELGRPPEEAELCRWLRPLLEALGIMHAASCFHRDVAPDNILLTDHGPVLLDFGAARRVIDGMGPSPTVVFKPGFAPIEQYGEVASMKQGPWTDLYALAGVVYAAIVGKPPPPAVERLMDDRMVPLSKLAQGRYGVPFLAAIDAALALHPHDRPQSAAEFWTRLSCGQSLQDLDLVRAIRRPDARPGPAQIAQAAASEPAMEVAMAAAMAASAEVTIERTRPAEDRAAADARRADVDAPADAALPITPAPAPWVRPVAPEGAPLRTAAAWQPPRRSGRPKAVLLAGAVFLVGLLAAIYVGLGDSSVAPPAVRSASVPAPAQVEASKPATAPVTAPAPPVTVLAPASPPLTPIPPVPPSPPQLQPARAAEPIRKAPVQAAVEPARAPRREAARPPVVAEIPVRPALAERPAPAEAAALPGRCAEMLQRASLEPLTPSQAASLRKECER